MVYLWSEPFPDVLPADVVIEAFSCKLPHTYVTAMARIAEQIDLNEKIEASRKELGVTGNVNRYNEGEVITGSNVAPPLIGRKPAWINLEYLSAENWVESHHKLPSPHPFLPLTKYFFFPGFSSKTGGLLLERDLLTRRDAFQRDTEQKRAFWQSINMEVPKSEKLKISLFAYENAALGGLFDVWQSGEQSILCLVPEGRILKEVGQYFGDDSPIVGSAYSCGSLDVRVLPFIEQDRYDELLWACDVNFVRGEDSFVRAQWAGKPFIWQIYPQHDEVHLKKLDAFLTLYGKQLGEFGSQAVNSLFNAWSIEKGAGLAWPAFISARGEIERHTRQWARHLAENNLALNLLDFSREIGRMRAFKIEGQ